MQKKYGNAYISVYKSMAGWKALLLVWDNEDQDYFPQQPSAFAYKEKKKAIEDGKIWAKAEELEFHI